MSAPLFDEPERVAPLTDGEWAVGSAPHRWRYMLLGEDGDSLVIDGHGIKDEEIGPLVWEVEAYADPDLDWSDVVRRTWLRKLDRCDEHPAGPPADEHCPCCAWFAEFVSTPPAGMEWWSWATPPGEPWDANRGKPGYFPVTIVDLEA